MSIIYNIYRMHKAELNKLKLSLKDNGLVEQKTISNNKFKSTFYFSENNIGNEVWWWEIYKDFIKDKEKNPRNIFHYGLLISEPKNKNGYVYLVSLGKSHFYLSKYIDKEFGINLAIRMADESTVLLKKSSYLSSTKKSDISSYEKFIVDSYEAGESVDHLKLKAKNKEIWGDRNIIFSDSVQLSSDNTPKNIDSILSNIDDAISGKSHISLPRYKIITDRELVSSLDKKLLEDIKNDSSKISLVEFESYGDNILFINECNKHTLFTRKGIEKHDNKNIIDNCIDIDEIIVYIKNLDDNIGLMDIRISLYYDDTAQRTVLLKNLLETSLHKDNSEYFLRNGTWCTFNETFSEYLKKSLEKIITEKKDDLIEQDYILWKTKKEIEIKNETSSDKITYREYYFNTLMSDIYKYELLDRKNVSIKSITKGNKNYKIEIADLYKDEEIISVKISSDTNELIYNIQQSITSFELYAKKEIKNKTINTVSLWFAFPQKITNETKITCINSIQFLLAIEHWKKRVESYGLLPKIYLSEHKGKT